MKLLDANLLLYGVDRQSPHQRRARAWLEKTFSSGETIGLPWAVLLAFVRLATKPRVFESPLAVGEALDLVGAWLARPSVAVVEPGPRHHALLRELLEPLGTAGNLTTDAHLAALAIEHGAELCSADRDFGRFPRLRLVNPLAE